MLNPDNWASTSTSLLQNAAVRDATANYLVDQLYANVNVAGKIDEALPPRLAPLAAPLAGALRNAAVQGTELALSRPLVQNAWRTVNRAAAEQLVAVVNGGNKAVSVDEGKVSLNLGTILNEVASRLGISADLGAKLPPAAATLVILQAKQIRLVQDIGQGLSGLAIALYILVPLLYVVTMLVAPAGRRRRTLMSIGFSGVVAGLVVFLFRSLIVTNVPGSLVKDASIRPAADAVVSIATTMLTQIAGAVILVGAVIVVCAWLAARHGSPSPPGGGWRRTSESTPQRCMPPLRPCCSSSSSGSPSRPRASRSGCCCLRSWPQSARRSSGARWPTSSPTRARPRCRPMAESSARR